MRADHAHGDATAEEGDDGQHTNGGTRTSELREHGGLPPGRRRRASGTRGARQREQHAPAWRSVVSERARARHANHVDSRDHAGACSVRGRRQRGRYEGHAARQARRQTRSRRDDEAEGISAAGRPGNRSRGRACGHARAADATRVRVTVPMWSVPAHCGAVGCRPNSDLVGTTLSVAFRTTASAQARRRTTSASRTPREMGLRDPCFIGRRSDLHGQDRARTCSDRARGSKGRC